MSEFLLDANMCLLKLKEQTGIWHYYLNALLISVLRNSKMVDVPTLNCTIRSCPRNLTKLWPVVFELLIHKFVHKMKN